MRLLHYDEKPVEFDPNRQYCLNREHSVVGKPNGLWVSVEGEDDWKWWCESEEFCLGSLRHVHEVTLVPDANILYITNPNQLLAFHHQYAAPSRHWHTDDDILHWGLDWARAAQDYQGIIIAPYFWDLRLDGPFWYYGWDCASGCIWDLNAISGVEEINQEELENVS
jgi:hypothetical protein